MLEGGLGGILGKRSRSVLPTASSGVETEPESQHARLKEQEGGQSGANEQVSAYTQHYHG